MKLSDISIIFSFIYILNNIDIKNGKWYKNDINIEVFMIYDIIYYVK